MLLCHRIVLTEKQEILESDNFLSVIYGFMALEFNKSNSSNFFSAHVEAKTRRRRQSAIFLARHEDAGHSIRSIPRWKSVPDDEKVLEKAMRRARKI